MTTFLDLKVGDILYIKVNRSLMLDHNIGGTNNFKVGNNGKRYPKGFIGSLLSYLGTTLVLSIISGVYTKDEQFKGKVSLDIRDIKSLSRKCVKAIADKDIGKRLVNIGSNSQHYHRRAFTGGNIKIQDPSVNPVVDFLDIYEEIKV